jgi:hypothetical protein
MTPARFTALSAHWAARADAAAGAADLTGLTVALLAHGMVCAAYLRHPLAHVMRDDPPTVKTATTHSRSAARRPG